MRFYRKTENFITLLLARLNVTFSTHFSFLRRRWLECRNAYPARWHRAPMEFRRRIIRSRQASRIVNSSNYQLTNTNIDCQSISITISFLFCVFTFIKTLSLPTSCFIVYNNSLTILSFILPSFLLHFPSFLFCRHDDEFDVVRAFF